MITAIIFYIIVPQIVGHNDFSVRVFQIIPFLFFVLLLFSDNNK